MNVDVFIGMGSNIEADLNIPRALEALLSRADVTGISIFYRSTPAGGKRQPPFTNGVVRINWAGTAVELKLNVLREIEAALGRRRSADRYADRQIDLDLLLFGQENISTPELTVPDPDIVERPFIYVPLLELEPDVSLPGRGPLSQHLSGSLLPAVGGLKPAVRLTEHLRITWRRALKHHCFNQPD